MRITWNNETWVAPIAEGVLVGSGDKIKSKIKTNGKLYDICRRLQDLLLGRSEEIGDVVHSLTDSVAPGIGRQILNQLLRVGAIVEEAVGATTDTAQSLTRIPLTSNTTIPTALLESRIEDNKIGLITDTHNHQEMTRLLDAQGIKTEFNVDAEDFSQLNRRLQELPDELSLIVCVVSNPLARLQYFPLINQIAIDRNIPFLMGYNDAEKAWIGPLVVPTESACFNCIELREQNHLPNLADYSRFRAMVNELNVTMSPMPSEMAKSLLHNLLVGEIIKYCSKTVLPATFQNLLEFNWSTMESSKHFVLKVPLCNVCGDHRDRPFVKPWN